MNSNYRSGVFRHLPPTPLNSVWYSMLLKDRSPLNSVCYSMLLKDRSPLLLFLLQYVVEGQVSTAIVSATVCCWTGLHCCCFCYNMLLKDRSPLLLFLLQYVVEGQVSTAVVSGTVCCWRTGLHCCCFHIVEIWGWVQFWNYSCLLYYVSCQRIPHQLLVVCLNLLPTITKWGS